MGIAARLDEMGKPAWIALMVLTFIIAWPVGLALLAYLIWSGRMGCGSHGRWHGRVHDRMERFRQGRWGGSSGNAAFDEYRAETLKRLEEEQREFLDFLDRLRKAKDKAEFDQFMADRKSKPQGPIIDGEQPA
ncbi:MAG TPA: DUF2852 domain-containing protein [Dongiaceae bacterium]|jgi:hypothetical protein|nr:DUF2852 domain-containing protein [Dongiaceae bacterium]